MTSNLFNKIWFIRLFSLIMAIFLFVFVSMENRSFQKSSMNEFASLETTQVISDVPVFLGEHSDDMFVTGLPEAVSVKISGPKNLVTQVSPENFQVRTETLTGKEMGKQSIRLEAEGLPKEISYEIDPARVSVSISEKKKIALPIEYDVDSGSIAQGAEISNVVIKPEQVQLSGPSEEIDKVERAMVKIKTQKTMDKSFTQRYKLQILDADGKQLAVNSDVTDVEVHVEIKTQGKDLAVNVVSSGEDLTKYTYQYKPAVANVHVSGDPAALADMGQIDVQVDVSALKSNSTVKGQLSLPLGVTATEDVIDIVVEVQMKSTEETSTQSETEQTTTPVVTNESGTTDSNSETTVSGQ